MIDMEADLIHRDFLLRESRFTELKGGFIEISSRHITKLILESLKEFYSGIIDSKRDKDHVKNIEGLLRILERREVLRYDLIEPLKVIASKYIKDEILNRRLADYEEKLKNEGPLLAINHYRYRVERSSPSASRNKISQSHAVNFYDTAQTTLPAVIYPSTLSVARTTSHSAPDIQEKVFRRVCENLGKFWRDLARFLGVKENEIDIIDAKSHLEIKEKAYEALLIFKSRCDSCNWKIKMQNALVKARRKDLAEMINEIDDR
ncbi:fas-associated death domain protein isoform X2 [Fopius arisanus]|uniref:Fas-associated death domain protein isoform X2 n=1 Tax=Fopius arisanus TaxID=64838 RepID=A0A9R1T5M2_9HYME|nr:PREDICTED: fas-associated death domain protein isoform X2 [Fopius arisanus]